MVTGPVLCARAEPGSSSVRKERATNKLIETLSLSISTVNLARRVKRHVFPIALPRTQFVPWWTPLACSVDPMFNRIVSVNHLRGLVRGAECGVLCWPGWKGRPMECVAV